MSAADICPDVDVGQPVPITYSSVFAIPAAWSGPPNVTISGEITHVASVYLARWSAPIICNGVTMPHGTGHEFGWDDKRWVSLGSFRRGGRRPGQWGERARNRRAKRRERARGIRASKRFDRYVETRHGQSARSPSEGP
jgi:hypothetical protein